MRKGGIYILLFLIFGFSALFSHGPLAMDYPDEAGRCLQCHEKSGIVKKFQNGETIPVYVDAGRFKASVHSFLGCSDCHRGYSAESHPETRYRSKNQYRLKSSLICRGCHRDEQIKSKPIHATLLKEEKGGNVPICTDCHGAHNVMPLTGGKIFTNEKLYCMSCHSYDIHISFKDADKHSARVDEVALENSVHKALRCSDCHYGFSSEEHPQRVFRTHRDYIIASSENCRRCHFDKYTRTLEGIHYETLNRGNLNAPVCIDCHGAHSIATIKREKILITSRCKRCHQEIYEIYSGSIHGNALLSNFAEDVPICIDCHRSHDIDNPLTLEYHEMIPDMCSNCHGNKDIMSKYGLSTDVVTSYLSDFHGVTLNFYKKQRDVLEKPARPIAVCTDCHGTHNISSTRGKDIRNVKESLMKRCQKCHEDVAENFPDAWLSHYEPSLRKAPLVFIINLLYKILIPFMIAGLILQVLLHIWRYSSNR